MYLAFSSDVLSVGSLLDVSDPHLSSSNQLIFLSKRTFVPNSLQVTLRYCVHKYWMGEQPKSENINSQL